MCFVSHTHHRLSSWCTRVKCTDTLTVNFVHIHKVWHKLRLCIISNQLSLAFITNLHYKIPM